MPTIDSTLSTLTQIRTKIRRLTRSPSVNQLTDQQIDDYVNTFVLYDFPQHLKLFSLRKVLTFYTQPNIDTYENNTVNPDDPLYNFINKVTSIHGPVYIAGIQAFYSQSREQFQKMYPMINNTELVGTGDGVTNVFNGTLSAKPVMAGNVTFTSIDTLNNALTWVDTPDIDPLTGLQLSTGTLNQVNATIPGWPAGTINYVTGVWNITFTAAPNCPGAGTSIYCQARPYTASKPYSMLYFDNKFILRPIPDMPYRVEVEAFMRPTELLTGTDEPKLSQWWQYIAYGAAKKVFEDRLDQESIQLIMPEFKQQELLVLRETIMQMSNERSSTIFTGPNENNNMNNGFGWNGF